MKNMAGIRFSYKLFFAIKFLVMKKFENNIKDVLICCSLQKVLYGNQTVAGSISGSDSAGIFSGHSTSFQMVSHKHILSIILQ